MKSLKLKKKEVNLKSNLQYKNDSLLDIKNKNIIDEENLTKFNINNIFLTDYKKEYREIKNQENTENSKTRNKNSNSKTKTKLNFNIVNSNNSKTNCKNNFKDKFRENINYYNNNILENSKEKFINTSNIYLYKNYYLFTNVILNYKYIR
jgi:hypothetical protein